MKAWEALKHLEEGKLLRDTSDKGGKTIRLIKSRFGRLALMYSNGSCGELADVLRFDDDRLEVVEDFAHQPKVLEFSEYILLSLFGIHGSFYLANYEFIYFHASGYDGGLKIKLIGDVAELYDPLKKELLDKKKLSIQQINLLKQDIYHFA